jgi:hypothetical protein
MDRFRSEFQGSHLLRTSDIESVRSGNLKTGQDGIEHRGQAVKGKLLVCSNRERGPNSCSLL